MLNQIFAITLKELKVIIRDRAALAVLFLLPMAFIFVMTVALQGVFDTGGKDNPVVLLVVNQDQGEIAAKVIADLGSVEGLTLVTQQDGSALTRITAENLITSGKYSVALVFPANFSDSIHAAALNPEATLATISFVADPAVGSQVLSPARGMVQGYVEREASLAQAPQLTELGFNQMAAQAPANQASMIRMIGNQFSTQFEDSENTKSTSLGVAYQVVAPAKYQTIQMPTSVEQNVPGYTIYGVFFIMQTIATSLFRERNDGTFRRIQAAPLSRAVFLTGKMLPYYLINLVQITLMFTVGVVVFKMSLGRDLLALVVLSLATAAAATGLGLLVTTLGKTIEQVSSLSTLLSVVLAAVGGSMVPIFVMPKFMQTVAFITPHAWALTGFQDVIVRGQGLSAVLPVTGILMAYALVFWGVAVWRFKYE